MVTAEHVEDEEKLIYSLRGYKSGDFFPEGNYRVYEKVTDLAANHVSNTFNIYVKPGIVVVILKLCLRGYFTTGPYF